MTPHTQIMLIGNQPSPGIGYLHAYLEQHNYAVHTIFIKYSPEQEHLIDAYIQKYAPPIIAIQILTLTRNFAYQLIEKIHAQYPNIIIIVGGIHTASAYESIIRTFPYVIAVLGEGELTLLELTRALTVKTDFKNIRGIAYMLENNVITTTPRPLIENLDSLPFPKHALYLNAASTATGIVSSRGCPHSCSFCCIHNTTQRKIRFRSIPNIIAELEYIKKTFPNVTYIQIADDTFLINNQRVIEFCDTVIQKKFHFKYLANGRFSPLSELLIEKLTQAGFIEISLGLESANDSIRERAHKMITREAVVHAVQLFSKTNIRLRIFLIVGLPGETWATIKETGLFIQKLQKIKYIYCWEKKIYPAAIYPHTELYQRMKNADVVTDDIWVNKNSPARPLYTLEHSEATLHKMHKELLTYISIECFFTIKGFLRQLPIILTSRKRQELCQKICKINFSQLRQFYKNKVKYKTHAE